MFYRGRERGYGGRDGFRTADRDGYGYVYSCRYYQRDSLSDSID